jgi:NAD(P)-dependent dehydrogenase (short-subunit alcohol dehydrogenase family)
MFGIPPPFWDASAIAYLIPWLFLRVLEILSMNVKDCFAILQLLVPFLVYCVLRHQVHALHPPYDGKGKATGGKDEGKGKGGKGEGKGKGGKGEGKGGGGKPHKHHHHRPLFPPMFITVPIIIAVVSLYIDVYSVHEPNANAFDGKLILVTGANSGIGFHTTRHLAARGATVIMGCRSQKNCREARLKLQAFLDSTNAAGKVLFIEEANCDLSSLSAVRAFAEAVAKQYGVPDIIVNNAGFSPDRETAKLTKDGLEGGFGSMHMGHFYLNKLLLEGRTLDKHVRVVNVASGMHRVCYLVDCFDDDFTKGDGVHKAYAGCSGFADCSYGRAKMSNVLHAWSMPQHYASVSAVSIDLGWVATGIQPWMKEGFLNPSR